MLLAILVTGIAGSLLYLLLMRQGRHADATVALTDILRSASALHSMGQPQRALQTLLDARNCCDDPLALEVRILEYQLYLQERRNVAPAAHDAYQTSQLMPAFLRVR